MANHEENIIRTRSRSRSETPQILSLDDDNNSEHHYDLRHRSRERSSTPLDTGRRRRSKSKSLPPGTVKTKVKNMNQLDMDPIVELNDTLTTTVLSEEPNRTIEKSITVTNSVKKSERRSERQRLKRQTLLNGESENTDEFLDNKSKKKTKRMLTSDYSSEEGDRDEASIGRQGSAYEFYKQQGDYWNKFPKTDYTYSLTSQCRYEVAPGVMAIPNMSRRSLHSDSNSFICSSSQSSSQTSTKESYSEENGTMSSNNFQRSLSDSVPASQIQGNDFVDESAVYRRTLELKRKIHREFNYDNSINENQINERYESWATPLTKSHSASFKYTSNVDSDAELDEAVRLNNKYRWQQTQKSSKFTNIVSTWFYTVLNLITFGYIKKKNESYTPHTSHYYRYRQDTKWSQITRWFQIISQKLYLFLINIALLDTWLLSRASNVRQRVQGRRTKILWLVFLPLALTFGCWLVSYLLSAIPSTTMQLTSYFNKQELHPVHSYSQDNIKADSELRNIIDLLVSRVQNLEAAKAEQTRNLSNITQVVEDLKKSDNDLWKHYEEKVLNLERDIFEKSKNQESCKNEELEALKYEFQSLKHLYSELKHCCDQESKTINEEEIREQADKVFAGYFGDSISKGDVVRIFQIMNSKIKEDNSGKSESNVGDSTSLGVDEMKKIVLGILKIYDADKTGRVDYALESAGGQVISTRCTQLYNIHTRAFKILGLTLYYESNNPRTVIQGNTLQPGMCWAFQDFPGYLLIKLRSFIYVTGFTIEHAPRANLPNGEMKSAPKKFNVWGLKSEDDIEPVMFGEYEFIDSNESLQYFPVQNTSISSPYEYVELRIHSNHGQLDYTCLYRFRVHGELA